MRHPLRRWYGRGDLHFVTFSCYRRRPYLGTTRARDAFVRILDEVRSRYRFHLVGYVVMPEHVHLLISEPAGANPSKILQVLKQKVSSELRRRKKGGETSAPFPGEASGPADPFGTQKERMQEPRTPKGAAPGPVAGAPAFWQRRFYDFNVWSEEKLKDKLDYMHLNPVERKLVGHPKHWPWSSWSFYEKGEGGLIRIDPVGRRT